MHIETEDQPQMDDARPTLLADRAKRLDAVLTFTVWLLVALLVSGSGWFARSVWLAQRAEKSSSPAMRALRDLEGLVRADPNNAALRVRLGEAQATAGLYEDAVSNLKQATRIDKGHSGAYLDLGMVSMSMKRPSAAKSYFLKVVDLTAGSEYANVDQRREQALYYLGVLSVADRDYEDAVGYLKGALRIRKDASDTYYQLALAFRGLEDDDQAAKNLSIALTFDPNYSNARYEMGMVFRARGEDASAAVEFRRALDTAPQARLPAEELAKFGPASRYVEDGTALLAAGKSRAAAEKAIVAVSIDPKDVGALLLHARALEAQKALQEALEGYRTVLEVAPGDATARAAVARLTKKTK